MTSSRYPLYALAFVVGGAMALWAGVSPFLLGLLVLCPLLMFFMMRGAMGRGMHDDTPSGESQSGASEGTKHGSRPTRPSVLDGSHERIDRP